MGKSQKTAFYILLFVLLKTFLKKVAEKFGFLRIYIYVSSLKLRNGEPVLWKKDRKFKTKSI